MNMSPSPQQMQHLPNTIRKKIQSQQMSPYRLILKSKSPTAYSTRSHSVGKLKRLWQTALMKPDMSILWIFHKPHRVPMPLSFPLQIKFQHGILQEMKNRPKSGFRYRTRLRSNRKISHRKMALLINRDKICCSPGKQ